MATSSNKIEAATTQPDVKYEVNKLYPDFPINQLQPNPDQPRKGFDADEDLALTESVKKLGVLVAILAFIKSDSAGKAKAMILAGERRYNAAKAAGLTTVPVIFKSGNADEIAIVENLYRSGFAPLDEAEALYKLKEDFEYKNKELVGVINKAESTISEILKLVNLPQVVKDEIKGSKKYTRAELIKVVGTRTSSDSMINAFNALKEKKATEGNATPKGSAKKGKGKSNKSAQADNSDNTTTNDTENICTLTETYKTKLVNFDISSLDDDVKKATFLESLKNLNELISTIIKEM